MSYRHSNLPENHPVRQLSGLARQIALPHEYEPERFPSFPALERTAKLGFNQPATIDVPTSNTSKLALFRQAAYPVWGQRTLTGSDAYTVTWTTGSAMGNNSGATQDEYTAIYEGSVSHWGNVNRAATTTYPGLAGSVTSPNFFPYSFMAMDASTGTLPWAYIPKGCRFSWCVSAPAMSAAIGHVVNYDIWTSPGEVKSSSFAVAGNGSNLGNSTANGTATADIWVRPRTHYLQCTGTVLDLKFYTTLLVSIGTASWASSLTDAGTWTVAGGTSTLFYPLVAPSEFANSQLPWYSTRVTASALLCTNVTTVLNKGGTVLAGRVSPQVMDPWSVTNTYVNLLHPAEKAFLPLETGLYTYCPPSTDMANFWDYTLPTGTGAASAPVHRLDNDSMVNFVFLTSPAAAETMALNVDWHIEFRTSSALFDVGMSAVTLETLHQAQIVLATAGFFFENPDHKKILNAVQQAIREVGPPLLSYVNPAAGKAAEYLFSKKPQAGMQGTSLTPKPVAHESRVQAVHKQDVPMTNGNQKKKDGQSKKKQQQSQQGGKGTNDRKRK